jgi:glutaredoxin 3
MKKVILYSRSGCPHCDDIKEFLSEHKVEYEEKDVMNDPEARNDLIKMGANGVPVLKVDDNVIVGFDEEKIKEALGL